MIELNNLSVEELDSLHKEEYVRLKAQIKKYLEVYKELWDKKFAKEVERSVTVHLPPNVNEGVLAQLIGLISSVLGRDIKYLVE